MNAAAEEPPAVDVAFASSVCDDVWHEQTGLGAFESWRFSAVSDDGGEALIITFYDNFPFSARYLENLRQGSLSALSQTRYPAVSFVYAVNGKVEMRALNEFGPGDFTFSETGECRIGASSFKFKTTAYGDGYLISLDLLTGRGRRISTELEWLSVESNLVVGNLRRSDAAFVNFVAPRSDVSGRITLTGRRGKTRRMVHFRGTGSHEQLGYPEAMSRTLKSEYMGCAHFADSTAFFYSRDDRVTGSATRLFVFRDGNITETNATPDVDKLARNIYGLKIPKNLTFTSTDGETKLGVHPVRLVRSGFCEVDMLSEMELELPDGKARHTLGMTEFVEPGHARRRLVRWLSDLSVAKNGKPPMF